MPETPITREQLLASIHVIEPGDLLVIRCPQDTTPRVFEQVVDMFTEKLKPLGIEFLVMTDQLSVDVVRKEETAD